MFFKRQQEALQQVELKYGRSLYHTAFNILRNDQDAFECVNDTLYKAWEAIPPERPEILSAYLSKITRNTALNNWKAKRTIRRGGGEVDLLLSELGECVSDGRTPDDAYEAGLVTTAINDCLAKMDKTMRIAFVLRYFHGKSISEICQHFDMSMSKIKSMLFRARKKLRIHLEKEGIIL